MFSKPKRPVLSVFRHKDKSVKKAKSYVDIRYPKPVYSPRFRPKVRKISEGNKPLKPNSDIKQLPNGIHSKFYISDTETSDVKSEDEEKKVIKPPSIKGKPSLWKIKFIHQDWGVGIYIRPEDGGLSKADMQISGQSNAQFMSYNGKHIVLITKRFKLDTRHLVFRTSLDNSK